MNPVTQRFSALLSACPQIAPISSLYKLFFQAMSFGGAFSLSLKERVVSLRSHLEKVSAAAVQSVKVSWIALQFFYSTPQAYSHIFRQKHTLAQAAIHLNQYWVLEKLARVDAQLLGIENVQNSPLIAAILERNLEGMQALLSHVDTDALNALTIEDFTLLEYALFFGGGEDEIRAQVLEVLIEKGVEIPNTLLHMAVQNGFSHCIDLLLNKDLDLNALDRANNRAVDYVFHKIRPTQNGYYNPLLPSNIGKSDQERKGWLEKLVEKGAVVSETLLHSAIAKGFPLCAEFLIDTYPDSINVQNNKGETPAHVAIRGKDKQTLELLERRGADLAILDGQDISVEALKISHATRSSSDLPQLTVQGVEAPVSAGRIQEIAEEAMTSLRFRGCYLMVFNLYLAANILYDANSSQNQRDQAQIIIRSAVSGAIREIPEYIYTSLQPGCRLIPEDAGVAKTCLATCLEQLSLGHRPEMELVFLRQFTVRLLIAFPELVKDVRGILSYFRQDEPQLLDLIERSPGFASYVVYNACVYNHFSMGEFFSEEVTRALFERVAPFFTSLVHTIIQRGTYSWNELASIQALFNTLKLLLENNNSNTAFRSLFSSQGIAFSMLRLCREHQHLSSSGKFRPDLANIEVLAEEMEAFIRQQKWVFSDPFAKEVGELFAEIPDEYLQTGDHPLFILANVLVNLRGEEDEEHIPAEVVGRIDKLLTDPWLLQQRAEVVPLLRQLGHLFSENGLIEQARVCYKELYHLACSLQDDPLKREAATFIAGIDRPLEQMDERKRAILNNAL